MTQIFTTHSKNIIIKTFMLAYFFIPNNIVYAQECAMELGQYQADYLNRTQTTSSQYNNSNFIINNTINIPIVVHILRKDDGTGGLSTNDLNISLTQLNDAFQQANFTFEICHINNIHSTYFHNTNIQLSYYEDEQEFFLVKPQLIPNTLNIFFFPKITAQLPNNFVCGWSAYPHYLERFGKDWIVMSNDCATNGSTLAHEVGHFFNLYHTFQGTSISIGIHEDELPDGSNCGLNVGDELCDTPAEPTDGIFNCVDANCIYSCYDEYPGYAPDPTNLMSSSQKHCRTGVIH